MIKLIIVIAIYFNGSVTVSQMESLYEDHAACDTAREHYASEEFNLKMTKKATNNGTGAGSGNATVIVDATCWNESTAEGRAKSKKPY